jgi:hypothetical protein
MTTAVFERDFAHKVRPMSRPQTPTYEEDDCESCKLLIEKYCKDTQHPQLKLLRETDITEAGDQTPVDLNSLMRAATQYLTETNKRHKVTIKKTYVNDIVM